MFAQATTPAKAAPLTVTTVASSLKVGLPATVIGAASTKLGIAIVAGITATALSAGGIATVGDQELPNRHAVQMEHSLYAVQAEGNNSTAAEGSFEYPCFLIDAYCPNGASWKGRNTEGRRLVPIDPEKLLVGPGPPHLSSVSLSKGYWVELKFCREIVDGPGSDIILVEVSGYAKPPDVFITDAAGQEYLLEEGRVLHAGHGNRIETGYDISGLSLPFVPYAVRIVGRDGGGALSSRFDLASVRARTHIAHGQHDTKR